MAPGKQQRGAAKRAASSGQQQGEPDTQQEQPGTEPGTEQGTEQGTAATGDGGQEQGQEQPTGTGTGDQGDGGGDGGTDFTNRSGEPDNTSGTGAGDEQSGDQGDGDGDTSSGEQPQTHREAVLAQRGPVNPDGNSGPGTGREAPAERTARMPAATVNTDPDAAPLDPPADSHTQTQPEHGHDASSTDHTYAQAGGRTIAGEQHHGLVGENDEDIDVDDLFKDPGRGTTYVIVKHRVYEVFLFANTTQPAKRLLFTEGQRLPRAQADAIVRRVEAGV